MHVFALGVLILASSLLITVLEIANLRVCIASPGAVSCEFSLIPLGFGIVGLVIILVSLLMGNKSAPSR